MIENKRDDISHIRHIGWGRSFTLALKSTIVGLLFGFVWVAIYTIIEYYTWIRLYQDWFTPDFSQILLTDLMNLIFPFIPFKVWSSSTSPHFVLHQSDIFTLIFGGSFSSYELLLSILGIVFSFLVYVSLIVPIIKYSLKEAGYVISWKRGYVLGIKSGIIGFVLATIFVIVGFFILLFSLGAISAGSSASPANFSLALMLTGLIVLSLISMTFVFMAEVATGAAVIKYATSQVKPHVVDWKRSFWVSIKANIIGLLWAILFALVFIIISGIIIVISIGNFSPSTVVAGASLILTMLIVIFILASLSPTASIIKYLTEEILGFPQTPSTDFPNPKEKDPSPFFCYDETNQQVLFWFDRQLS